MSTCPGFQWVGQSFQYCDGCGEPYWDHQYDCQIDRDSGPFGTRWKRKLISKESKARVKARWEHIS